jgi:hypothetical protein
MADIVILGLSITSSWGNGHATTYRALQGAEAARPQGDVPGAQRALVRRHRDLPNPPYCRTVLYRDWTTCRRASPAASATADAVIVGSYVPEAWRSALGDPHGDGPVAFYDIDTPVTLGKLERGDEEYLAYDSDPGYDLYLSFTGGPTIARLRALGSPRAAPALLLRRPRRPCARGAERRWRIGLSRHLFRRSPARAGTLLFAPARPADESFRGRRAAISPISTGRERRAHAASAASRALRLLLRPGFHAERTRADMRAPAIRQASASSRPPPAACPSSAIPGRGSTVFPSPGAKSWSRYDGRERLASLNARRESDRRAIARARANASCRATPPITGRTELEELLGPARAPARSLAPACHGVELTASNLLSVSRSPSPVGERRCRGFGPPRVGDGAAMDVQPGLQMRVVQDGVNAIAAQRQSEGQVRC